MSYDLDVNSAIVEPEGLKRFSKICCVRKILRRWATTQVNCVSDLVHFNQATRVEYFFDCLNVM